MLTHKEMTKHIRGRLKAAAIPARCRLYTACGTRYIAVATTSFEGRWSADQLREIGVIAQVNGLTEARRSPIDLGIMVQLTESNSFHFEFHAA